MIIVKIMGGLGNQMFQYAAGRALAQKRDTRLYLDTSGYESMAEGDTPRNYELDVYNITAEVASPSILNKIVLDPANYTIFNKVARRLGIGKVFILGERGSGYDEDVLGAPNNTYLSGWWQSDQYFRSIRDDLVREFEPRTKPDGKNAELLKSIQQVNAVSIHVRRGDYVQNAAANTFHGLAPIDYYSRAIKHIEKSVVEPHFFVFSDDLEWCKTELPLPQNTTYVEGNAGEKAFEDIRLMKHCKHNIIANSSFSWWGAWLNQNPTKIVVAPKIWFQNAQANSETDIVPAEWKRI